MPGPHAHRQLSLLLRASPKINQGDTPPPKNNRTTTTKKKQVKPQTKGKVYQQIGAPINPNICSFTKSEILQHIKERTKARRSQNFQKADQILSILKRENVFVNDATKQWRADGRSFIDFSSGGNGSTAAYSEDSSKGKDDNFIEYTKARNSRSISSRDEEYVLHKLRQRHEAKLNRDYDTADDILDELRFLKNVEVDDTKYLYRVVDPFKVEYTFGGKRINNVHPDILQDIESKIKERDSAKKRKDYELADLILKQLTEKYAVRVDDKKKEWHFMRKKENDKGAKKLVEKQQKDKPSRQSDRKDDDSVSDWSAVDNESNGIMPEGISLGDESEEQVNNDEIFSMPIPEGIVISDYDEPIQGTNTSLSLQQSRDDLVAELESMTIPILKGKLREAGLPVSGRKMELIERLMNIH